MPGSHSAQAAWVKLLCFVDVREFSSLDMSHAMLIGLRAREWLLVHFIY